LDIWIGEETLFSTDRITLQLKAKKVPPQM